MSNGSGVRAVKQRAKYKKTRLSRQLKYYWACTYRESRIGTEMALERHVVIRKSDYVFSCADARWFFTKIILQSCFSISSLIATPYTVLSNYNSSFSAFFESCPLTQASLSIRLEFL